VAAVLLAAMCSISPSWAQQQWRPAAPGGPTPTKAAIDEARDRYKRGIRLYEEEGAVEAALIELQRAYDLAPRWQVLYNIGLVARSHRDYVTALRAFERYLADGGNQVPAARRAEVEKEMDAIRSFVAKVEVQVDVEGAAVSVDDLGIGKSPLGEAALVNAGRRKISATKDGQTATKSVSVAGGDSVKVELSVSEPKPSATPTPAPVPGQNGTAPAASTDTPPSSSATPPDAQTTTPQDTRSYAWLGFVATGALALGAGITGGLALAAQSDLDEQRYTGPEVPSDVQDQQSKVDTLAAVTDVLAASAVVALGITVVIMATDSSSSTGKASKPGVARATDVEPSRLSIRVSPRGTCLMGSF
jgi:hypothetical protein